MTVLNYSILGGGEGGLSWYVLTQEPLKKTPGFRADLINTQLPIKLVKQEHAGPLAQNLALYSPSGTCHPHTAVISKLDYFCDFKSEQYMGLSVWIYKHHTQNLNKQLCCCGSSLFI